MRRSPTITRVIAAAATAMLVFSGCSKGSVDAVDGENTDDAPPAAAKQLADDGLVYDFESILGEPAPEIAVIVPQSLIDAAGPDGQGLLYTSAKFSAHELPGAKYCAVDVAPSYIDGAIEQLSKPSVDDRELEKAEEEYQQRLDQLFQGFKASTKEEVAQLYFDSLQMADSDKTNYYERELQKFAEPNIDVLYDEAWAKEPKIEIDDIEKIENITDLFQQDTFDRIIDYVIETTHENLLSAAQEKIDKANEVPIAKRIVDRVNLPSTIFPMSEFDEAAPEEGTYYSDDYRSFTVVQSCALSPMDDETGKYFNLRFLYPSEQEGSQSTTTLASLTIVTMKNGTVSVADSSVNGYVRDSNGDWIAE